MSNNEPLDIIRRARELFNQQRPARNQLGPADSKYIREVGFSQQYEHFYLKAEEYLRSYGVYTEYISPFSYVAVLAGFLYHNDLDLPIDFWQNEQLTPSSIFLISDAEYRHLSPYRIEKDDYLFYVKLTITRIFLDALAYLPYQTLLIFYHYYSKEKLYFNTKREILYRFRDNIKTHHLFEQLKNFYPDKPRIFDDPNYGVIFPPKREKPIDPPIPTRKELAQLIIDKSPHLINYSNRNLAKASGWINHFKGTNFHIIEIIKQNINKPSFNILNRPELCSTQHDINFEPFEGLIITFGTYLDFACYSAEDLEQSFIVSDVVLFRDPWRPQHVFRNVEDLLLILRSEGLFESLARKIERGLQRTGDLEEDRIQTEFDQLSPDGRKLAKNIFESLFYAGMYQRVWRGPGYPFPMKTIQTSGSCLENIEAKMTPLLSKIRIDFEMMNPNDQNIIEKLPMLYVNIDEIYPEKIMDFVAEVGSGNFCIEMGNGLMISTAYHYLRYLGVRITDFNIDNFETASTSR